MKKRLSIVLCMTLMATSLLAGCKKKEEAPEPTETVSEAERNRNRNRQRWYGKKLPDR